MQFGVDIHAIEKRHAEFAKRQVIDAAGYDDESYPTFYGPDFSNVGILHCRS